MARCLRTTSTRRRAWRPRSKSSESGFIERPERRGYFLSESAIHSLCRMLSTVAPWPSLLEVWDATCIVFWIADGRLETRSKVGECCSWLVPYMIRAKLRLDIRPSRRALRGYLQLCIFQNRPAQVHGGGR